MNGIVLLFNVVFMFIDCFLTIDQDRRLSIGTVFKWYGVNNNIWYFKTDVLEENRCWLKRF